VTAKIVVGIDGSEPSEDALRWAVEEGRVHGALVVAVHAWEPPVLPADVEPVPARDYVGILAEVQEAAERLVEESVRKVAGAEAGARVDAVAVEGRAAEVLVDAAADADLLVVGSRGLGGFLGLLLGSVSQQCVNHAPCPVLVHRRPRGDGAGS
jgi:nucleotide-binding universal stress UspA family protein